MPRRVGRPRKRRMRMRGGASLGERIRSGLSKVNSYLRANKLISRGAASYASSGLPYASTVGKIGKIAGLAGYGKMRRRRRMRR